MTFEFKPVDLPALVTNVANGFHALIEERDFTLRTVVADAPISIVLDAAKMQQVLRNLLSNAIKFSPQGGIIELRMHCLEEKAVVAVADQGAGIPPAELDMIFGKFMQSSTTKSGAGGTGLGLAICREIVAAHRGRIWAENRPEGGAVFTFEMPLRAVISQEMPPTPV